MVQPNKTTGVVGIGADAAKAKRLDEIRLALGGIVRWSRVAFFDRIIEGIGLPLDRSTITILNLLIVNGRLRYSELSELLAVDRSTASRQVAAAISAGLVTQTADPSDGRARILMPTKRGEMVAEKASAAWLHVIESLVDDWDEGDQEQLAILLRRLVTHMEDQYYTR